MQRSEYLDAMAAWVESTQQITRWKNIEQARRESLAKLKQPKLDFRLVYILSTTYRRENTNAER